MMLLFNCRQFVYPPGCAPSRAILTSETMTKVPEIKKSSEKQVNFKAQFFKALSNPLRIRILNELRAEELTVSQLAERLEVELPNVSQQLAVLRGKNIVVSRKQGIHIHYGCVDPTVFKLIDVARELFNNHLIDIQETLKEELE